MDEETIGILGSVVVMKCKSCGTVIADFVPADAEELPKCHICDGETEVHNP